MTLTPQDVVAPTGTAGLDEGLAAYRLCLAGRTARGEASLASLLARADLTPAGKAWLEALLGIARRLRGAMDEAAESLARTAGADDGLAALMLILELDARVQAGRLEEARAWLEQGFPSLGTAASEISAGWVRAALGQQEEAERLFERATPKLEGPALDWAVLLACQARLDAQRPANDAAKAVRARLERERRFDERFVRALWLEGQTLVAGVVSARQHPAVARAVLKDSRGYATNMPLYRLSAEAFLGILDVAGGDERGQQVALAAVDALAEQGLRYEAARVTTWLSVARSMKERDRSTPVLARARNFWHELGAPARANRLVGPAGAGAASSSVLGASVAMSAVGSSMAQVMLEEDVHLQAVFDLTREVTSTRQVAALLERIVSSAVKVVKAERGALLRLDAGSGALTCVATAGLSADEVREESQTVSFGVIRACLERQEAILTDNAMVDERFQGRASVQASDLRSIACVPLLTPRGALGILYVDSSARSRLFTPVSRDLLSVFGAQAATALENALAFEAIEALNTGLEQKVAERTQALATANAELKASFDELTNTRLKLAEAQRDALEREMKLARGIQESLIPRPGRHQEGAVVVCGRLEQASFCGGDFWTYGRLDDSRVFLLVGDVTGHGMPAALLTAVAKSSLDTMLPLKVARSPAVMLERLNGALFESTKGQLQMTAWLGVVDLDARTLQYASAGHPFPLYLDRSQGLPKLTALVARGPRLGEALEASFEQEQRAFTPGDDVVLYTDGLTECRSPEGKPWGERLLRRQVAEVASAAGGPEHVVDAVFDAARAHYGSASRDDDVTLVVARLGGAS